MEWLKIILLCNFASVVYGILHDQVTARVCVEYFTIGHPPIFETTSPTLLALGWGVLATWWVGLILGVGAALTARTGRWPRCTASRLVRPLLFLMAATAGASLAAGLCGYFAARAGAVRLTEPLASLVPTEKHFAFLADLWAHLAAYAVGIVGGIVINGLILICRRRAAVNNV